MHSSDMTKEFNFIDLFAGIGGIRMAFEEVGGTCVFSSEWDKHAQDTYEANFGERPHGDITKIKTKDIPDHDVLLAGFPCQPFSQAGKRLGFNDTRGTLFFDIARIVRAKKPKFVVLENVRGFLNHDGGNTFNVVSQTLNKIGYDVHHKVLCAKDFGVPQNRNRIIIIGVNRKKIGKNIPFVYPEPTGKITSVGKILSKKVPIKYTISDKMWLGHKSRKAAHKLKGNGFGYSLFNSKSVYTNTISARYYKDGSEILIEQKNKNPRRLTPREAARLQGFPDTFIIPVSDSHAYKQFGNSVAVPMLKAVAEQIIKII
jgi:DNA (cytosine-5)-methyltransferase 1